MHTTVQASATARGPAFPSGRIAVAALFSANGFAIGSWAPKIPEFAETHGLSEGTLGLMILVFGLGSIAMMPVIGAMIARNGSSFPVKLTTILFVPALLILTFAPTIATAAIAIFFFGGVVGGMDVAMNANAVVVEKRMRRAIMSSCHGFWSLGGLAGAGFGGLMIGTVGVAAHVLIVTVILAGLSVLALSRLDHDGRGGEAESMLPARLPRTVLPYLLGVMALFCMTPEGAVLDWSALYLRQELSASAAQSGFAFAAFSATMALMRFAGDRIRDRLGAVTTLRVCALFAVVGLALAGQAPNVAVAIMGFALAGIGISNMVPILFSAAGNMPGIAPGVALSLVTFMGYSGILTAPSIIGFVAEYVSFSAIFTSLPVLVVVVIAFSTLARHADVHER